MPPFTYDPHELFAAIVKLANDSDQSWRFTKKGDKRPAYDVEASMQSRKRNIKARQEAATEHSLAITRAARAMPPKGQDIASRMLTAMEPGSFYGMGDLIRMIGEPRSSRGKVHQVLVKRGWVEAIRNPAYSGSRKNPWEIMAGAEPEPERLYRLTEVGLERRAALARQSQV